MENKTTNNEIFFTKEALIKMLDVQGKVVEKIIIVLWQNVIDAANSIEIIDSLQLRFTDGTRITLGCNDNSDGLDVVDINFVELKKQLEEEFGGKIKLHALDAGKTKMWLGIEGKTLEAIQLTKENDYYKADSVLLNFGDEKRAVSISHSDGIIIDYYDEV